MKTISSSVFLVFFALALKAQTVSTFESLSLPTDSFWDGTTNAGEFANGNALFQNENSGWWSAGFAYSNMKDSTTEGYANQYSARTAVGYNNSTIYAVGQKDAYIKLTGVAKGKGVAGVYVTNATYAALSMKKGDSFAKKFGGVSGNDADWFKLSIIGYNDNAVTDTVHFYLADFRSTNDYIVSDWRWVDLKKLGNVDSVVFAMSSSDNSGPYMNTPAYFAIDDFTTLDRELFHPAVDVKGTNAMHKDSSAFVAWASGATLSLGYQDISNSSLGYASVGSSASALGKAGDNALVSLGDGGSATLTFADRIKNEEGYDFAVFENSFSDDFLELAFVEVSSDGVNYFRFPATSYTDTTVQTGSFGYTNPTDINNLAGKYRALYGTPFDLEELKNENGLDVNNITHVKIVDVVGNIQNQYASRDQYGNKVNDPWPTAFASSGFDLDAVGVIHSLGNGVEEWSKNDWKMYPNPTDNNGVLNFVNVNGLLSICDLQGKVVYAEQVNQNNYTLALSFLNSGMYIVSLTNDNSISTQKLIVR
ncbi:MAG: DUF4465 domain-containing protein [Flavobacteriales bacterium]